MSLAKMNSWTTPRKNSVAENERRHSDVLIMRAMNASAVGVSKAANAMSAQGQQLIATRQPDANREQVIYAGYPPIGSSRNGARWPITTTACEIGSIRRRPWPTCAATTTLATTCQAV